MTLEARIINIISQLKLDKVFLTSTKRIDQQKLSRYSQFILAIAIIWSLSQLTWLLLSPPPEMDLANKSKVQVDTTQANNSRINLNNIISLNLFGQYQAEAKIEEPKEVEAAPITSLNLKLMGVVASDQASLSAAIIEKSGTQSTYGIGDKVDGTQAVIREIFADRVILEQRKRRETLMLEGVEFSAKADASNQTTKAGTRSIQPNKNESRTPKRKRTRKLNTKQKKTVEQFKQEFAQNPGNVTDYIKASPFKRDGELVGYKLRPGKDAAVFRAFGLRNGDIAVEINGYDLKNLSQAMTAMQELRSATEAQLTVERNGEIIETLFTLN